MTSTYEERLAIFKKWPHTTPTSEALAAAEFCFESGTKNLTTCSECSLTLSNWKLKRDPMKAHMRQSPNCVFAQELDITSKETSVAIPAIALVDSASTKPASTNCIASSPQIFYLTIKDLYHKQKALLAKTEEESTANPSSSSASTEPSPEPVIQSDVILAASSILTPASKDSKVTFSRSTSPCPTPAILLASQSSYLLAANQPAAHISYQHTVMAPSFSYEKWLHTSSTSKALVQAGFRHTPTKLSLDCTTCRRCGLILEDWKPHDDPIKEHLRRSSECPRAKRAAEQEAVAAPKQSSKPKSSKSSKTSKSEEFAVSPSSSSAPTKSTFEPIIKSNAVLAASSASIPACISILDTEKLEAEKASTVAQEAMKQEAAAAAIEAIKPEACAKDIGFFDPTMQIDLWEEFRISAFSASFLQHLAEIAANYRKKSVIKILSQCLRGSALQWLKDQLKFISLNDFKTAIAKVFSPSPASEASPDQAIINSSPQKYHRCPECDAQFSSTLRLLAHTQKDCSKSFTCKHCEKAFASNNKLHEHVRLHHIRKSYNKTLRQRFAEEKDRHINLSISRPTPPTTSRSMAASARPSPLAISMTKAQAARSIVPPADSPITSMNSAAPKSSRRHGPTCTRSTPPPSPLRISVLSHTASKAYMTMKELFEMFAEKLSKRSMNIIQKRSTSSCSPGPRQTRIKPLRQRGPNTAMLAGKQSRRSLDAIRKRMRSSLSSMSGQAQITSYFKPAGQPNPTSANSFKSAVFTSCPCPAPRACFPVNRAAGTSQIAIDVISSLKSRPKSKTPTTKSSRSFGQEYIAVADVDHINKGIRVGTPLTNAGGYNSVKRFKLLKSAVFISSLSSALRPSLPANHDSVMPQMLTSIPSRTDLLRALINQVAYAPISSRLRRSRQRYIAAAAAPICP